MSNDIYALKMKFDYMIPVCFTNYRQQQQKKKIHFQGHSDFPKSGTVFSARILHVDAQNDYMN
jgi:hypothetical protein